MANKKRPSLSDRMAETFKPIPKEIVPTDPPPFVQKHKRHQPGFPENFHVMEIEPATEHPMIRETREMHAKPIREYPGYVVDLPSGQKAYWSEFTPQAAIDKGLLTDKKLNHWADQWMQPGGNRYAEYLYADRLYNVYGMWENRNLHPASKDYIPWSDRSHYFDWIAWKAQYNKLKG